MATPTSITFDRAALDQLRAVFSTHRNEMSEIARNMSRQLNGMGGMGMPVGAGVRQGASLEDSAAELKKFIFLLKRGNQTLSATEKYQLGAARRQLKATNDAIDAVEAERKAREENREELEDGAEEQRRNTKEVSESTRRLANFAEKVVSGTLSFNVLTKAAEEFSQAYRQGFNWNALSDTVNAALKMGMSPKDMMDFQKRFRRVSNTLQGGIKEFNDTVGASTFEWMHYTGSLKEAAIAQGEFSDLALSMGIGAKDMKTAVGGMFGEFKKLQAATSMTAEEFIATQKSLLAEKSVRDKLIGLQGKERINYMNKLTDTAYMFQTLGLQKEAAEGMVKLLEAQSAKTGLTRLREGAQLQAAAGALQMDPAIGNELNRLYNKKNRSQDEDERLANLASTMSKEMERRRQMGGVNEYFVDALAERLPSLNELKELGAARALSEGAEAKQTAIMQQQLDIQERDSGIYSAIKENLVKYLNIFDGWSQSMLAALAGFVAGKLAMRSGMDLAGLGRGAAGAGGGGAPGALGSWKGGAGMMKGGLIGMIAGGVGAYLIENGMEDGKDKDIANTALAGASLGTTVGGFFGPIGMLLGAAVGGAAGGLVGIIANQKTMDQNLDDQKKKLIDQTNLDERRYQMAREQYQKEINQLTEKGKLSDQEQARVDELKKRMADNDKDHAASQNKASVNELGYQLNKQAMAKDWMAQAAKDIQKGGMIFDSDADDVNATLSQYRGKLSAAGLKTSDAEVQAQFYAALKDIASKSDSATANQSFDAIAQLQEGKKYDAKLLNPMIRQAMDEMTKSYSTDFASANQAAFSTKMNTPEAIAAMKDQVASLSDQMAKDKADLAALQTTSPFDETGLTSKQAADVQKRIDMTQQTLNALQQLAAKDNTVKFESEQALVDVLDKLSKSLDKGSVKRVRP